MLCIACSCLNLEDQFSNLEWKELKTSMCTGLDIQIGPLSKIYMLSNVLQKGKLKLFLEY